ncbi:hypothetical protein GCM10027399_07570 [Curvibacter fontanus]|jgi:hypothetical protein
MDTSLILVKTDKGVEEIRSRSFGLSQTLRALLIMADGSISMSGLLHRTAQSPLARENIEWLVSEGFVEPVPPKGRPASRLSPRDALIALSRGLLGAEAPKVIERLKDVPESPAELQAAVERCHKFIKLTIDETKAAQFLQAGRALLS